MVKKEMPRPLGNRVLVKRDETEAKSKGGILLPEVAKTLSATGEVLLVGEGEKLQNGEIERVRVARGDRVVFSPYASSEIEHEGVKLLIIEGRSVLAVLP